MNVKTFSHLCFLLFYLDFFPAIAQEVVPDRIIFKLEQEPAHPDTLRMKLQEQLPGTEIVEVWQKFPPALPDIHFKVTSSTAPASSLHLVYELRYKGKEGPSEVAERLGKVKGIRYAQPHYLPRLAYVPNDEFLYRNQAYYQNIQLFEGWDISRGDSNMVIGLPDSGTDPDHPDLVNNIAYNYNDPVNGIDDDQDGYIDNFIGWDVAEDDNNPQSVKSQHGVHLSGVISATADNGIGVAGIGYRCRFLPVKITEDSLATLIGAYEGVKYAADAGCAIINCSWGSYFAGPFEEEVIDYAVQVKNCLVIAAAGNDDKNDLFFPAAFEHVMAVASVDDEDRKVMSSNYHEDIDIAAPGRFYYSTWNEGLYETNTGTSVATSVVSGVAGILKGYYPDLSNIQLIELMKSTSDFIYDRNKDYIGQLGRGRINLFRALTGARTPEYDPRPFLVYPNPVHRSSHRTFHVYFYLEEAAEVSIDMIAMNGTKWSLLQPAHYANGVYEYDVNAENYASGLYLLRLKRNEELFLQKLVID